MTLASKAPKTHRLSVGIVSRTNEEQEEITSISGDRYRKLIFERGHLVGAVLAGDVGEIGLLTGMVRRRDERMDLGDSLANGSASSYFARNFFLKGRPLEDGPLPCRDLCPNSSSVQGEVDVTAH